MNCLPANSPNYPIAIIGGGLAGSAAGTILARGGWRVAILERDTFPRDKLCGEFLSGESCRLLDELGCLHKLMLHAPPRITHARFIGTSGKVLEVQLPAPALGISRRLLDEVLFQHACECGAHGFTNCEVRDISNAENAGRQLQINRTDASEPSEYLLLPQLTIGAYGRRGKLDHSLNRAFLQHVENSVGFKMHHRPSPDNAGAIAIGELTGVTEIYGFDGGYCGVNLVETGMVNVCMLMRPRALKKVGSGRWSDIVAFLAENNPALGKRLQALEPLAERPLTVSGMPFTQKEQSLDNLLFIGDAAGMIAPLCGDGQAMALESGVRVAKLIMKTFPVEDQLSAKAIAQSHLARNWTREWRKQFLLRMRVGKILQSAMLQPAMGNAALSILRRAPGLTSYLAAVTRGKADPSIGNAVPE